MLVTELYNKILLDNERALAKACSLVEDRQAGFEELLNKVYPHAGYAKVIGLTGAPGSGKSTLINALAIELLKRECKVAIIAVDPSSQITAGAVLGDRIRMKQAAESQKIFVRSVSSRGQRGGLALAISDLVNLFDAAKFDYVLIETVGVGQVETDVVDLVDYAGLVLTPSMGDEVQAMKAGILELVNFIVINKRDLAGVDLLEAILKTAATGAGSVSPVEIYRTNALTAEGIVELVDQFVSHFSNSSYLAHRKQKQQLNLLQRITREIDYIVRTKLPDYLLHSGSKIYDDCAQRRLHPAAAAKLILSKIV